MKRSILLMLVLGLFAGAGLFSRTLLAGPAGPLYELSLAQPTRVIAARLSIPTVYHRCTETPAPDSGVVPGVQCGDNGDIPPRLGRLAAGRKSLHPDSLHAAALAMVLWGDISESSLNATIELLERALALAPDRVSLLVDLSALYLARAQWTGNPHDLDIARERAHEALNLDPGNPNALFNAALAAQAIPLDAEAKTLWDNYLAVDRASPWVEEARENQRVLLKQPLAPTELPEFSTEAEVDSFAKHYPQEARLFGWETVLNRWANATLNDSAARATFHLTIAEQLGAALERQDGDASLTDAVRAIRDAQNNPTAMRKLAQAHRDYACGQAFFRKDGKIARECFDQVLRLNPPSDVLISSTKVARAGLVMGDLTSDEVKTAVDLLRADVDVIRHPALAARLDWILGKGMFDRTNFREAREPFKRAALTFGRLREGENYGATRRMEGWSLYETGDRLAAYSKVHEGGLALRPYRSSPLHSTALFDRAKYAARDGMPLAIAAFLDESLLVALQAESPAEITQARIARAERWSFTDNPHRAARELDSAELSLSRVSDSSMVERLRSMRAVTDADSPAEVGSALTFFKNGVWRIAALMRRADLYLATKDFESAGADLDSVTADFWRTSQAEKNFHQRAAVIEQARGLFDKLVILHVDARRPVESLRALERGRVSFAPGGNAQSPGGPLMAPQGQVALEYALIGDQLLIWMVRGRTVTLFRRTVNRDTILHAIDQANAALESVERADAAQAHLRHLHEWLIRPVRDSLPLDTPLVIVADGEIAGVPFAALRDAERNQYLIEKHLLRFAATLAEAAQPPLPAARGRRPLLIADPEFDRKEHSTLNPLGGARREMNSLLPFYPGADTLSGSNATVDALRARAPLASVIHYAGHAIFDDTRPERSFLVLAGSGRLAADTVGSMNLRGVRMVVLSACRTLRARQGRSGGFAGLSGALLNAGAGGVVGSLWKVDDDLAQPLMVAFHREYQREPDPAQALRKAQLQMLRSKDARKSPAAWAGFRYVGR